MNIIQSLTEARTLRDLENIEKEIESFYEKISSFSDDELKAQTLKFKERIFNGEKLDSLLPEAYAVLSEAMKKTIGFKHYPVQFLGGIALHQGRVAEMKTGEGKTLVATLPAFLNALTGYPVHIMTANDYLAKRDSEIVAPIFEFFGLSVGYVDSTMSDNDKRKAYNSSVTYGTTSSFGFDFLKDNLVYKRNEKVMRGLGFAIVDEADSLLLDQANTPLVISTPEKIGDKSLELIKKATQFVTSLNNQFIEVDRVKKTATLTDEGVDFAEKFFKVEFSQYEEYLTVMSFIEDALKAKYLFFKEKDYFVQDGKIVLVDQTTGRPLPSHRYEDGVQQAIEDKENLEVTPKTKTLGTITIQSFLRHYRKISGMSGTIKSSEDELKDIYNLDVVQIPTNKPIKRIDHEDELFVNSEDKYDAIVEDILESHKKGQPVLVGTLSIEESASLSERLMKMGIKHNVLNAKNLDKEARIIANAGRFGAVTIATDMAGRGTDIMLGGNAEELAIDYLIRDGVPYEIVKIVASGKELGDEKLKKLQDYFIQIKNNFKIDVQNNKSKVVAVGGLKVIGTQRHESIRIDDQLRGRAGRQGEIGESKFYISIYDELASNGMDMKLYRMAYSYFHNPSEKLKKDILKYYDKLQKIKDSVAYSSRKSMVMYEQEIDRERDSFYGTRDKVLDMQDMDDLLFDGARTIIARIIKKHLKYNIDHVDSGLINDEIKDIFAGIEISPKITKNMLYDENEINAEISRIAYDVLQYYIDLKESKSKQIDSDFEKLMLLKIMDSSFMAHLKAMKTLSKSSRLQVYAMKDSLEYYQREGHCMFDNMIDDILSDLLLSLLNENIENDRKNQKIQQSND